MYDKIVIAGAGYVGLANAIKIQKDINLNSLNSDLTLYDINETRVEMINKEEFPLKEVPLCKAFKSHPVKATTDENIVKQADLVIIAVNTNLNNETKRLDMSAVESVAMLVKDGSDIVIKSTSDPGFTINLFNKIHDIKPNTKVFFVPEFLRENNSWYDVNHPSRVIIGTTIDEKDCWNEIGDINTILNASNTLNSSEGKMIVMSSTEAEFVKVASNSYLAMRVAFFNEISDYCTHNDLNTKNIIKGMTYDPRIGRGYNNPSFGYGGYCLPKDSANFASMIHLPLAEAITLSNDNHISTVVNDLEYIANRNNGVIGIYKLAMKSGSDNARMSASGIIAERLMKDGFKVIIFDDTIDGYEHDFNKFIESVDIIALNRYDTRFDNVDKILYTLDLFGDN